jgi:plastocyanin
MVPATATPAPAPAATQSQVREVAIDNFSFNPPMVTVAVGTTVTWVNHDDVPHTVTANDKAFTSKALDTDDRFSRVFTAPGTYSYFCMVHPHMTGQIIVK